MVLTIDFIELKVISIRFKRTLINFNLYISEDLFLYIYNYYLNIERFLKYNKINIQYLEKDLIKLIYINI